MLWQHCCINTIYHCDNWNNSTFNLILELNGASSVSNNIPGDTDISVVQVLGSHPCDDGTSYDLVLGKCQSLLSESEEEYQLPSHHKEYLFYNCLSYITSNYWRTLTKDLQWLTVASPLVIESYSSCCYHDSCTTAPPSKSCPQKENIPHTSDCEVHLEQVQRHGHNS